MKRDPSVGMIIGILALWSMLLPAACASTPQLPPTPTRAATSQPTDSPAPATATQAPTGTPVPSPTPQPPTATALPTRAPTAEPTVVVQPLLAKTLNDRYHLRDSYIRTTTAGGDTLVIRTWYDSASLRIMPYHAELFVQLLEKYPEIDDIWFTAEGSDPYTVTAKAVDVLQYGKGELTDFELMLRMEVTYEEHECDC